MQPYLEIFGNKIPSYGFLLAVAYAAAFICALLRRKKYDMSLLDTTVAMFMAGFGALMGGKIFYVLQGIPEFIYLHNETGMNFLEYFNSAGFIYYGGFIGCMLMLLLCAKVYAIPALKLTDALLPALPLAQSIGRVGCFLAGCCYGMPLKGGIIMTQQSHEMFGVALLPVQLIEAVACIALFIVMLVYESKPRRPGGMLCFYFVGYGIIRFVLEFFRYDDIRGFVSVLSVSQWISLGLIAVGLVVFIIRRKK